MSRHADGTGNRIEIRDLRVLGIHGVLPEERERAQPFSLDIDVALDMTEAISHDRLEDTTDYAVLLDRAVAVLAGPSFQLLEALAGAVGDAILGADPRISDVIVTLRKLRPPVPCDVGSIGVRVRRARVDEAGEDENGR